MQKTFDYFRTTTSAQEINEIYLSGGASRTEGLLEYLTERFQLPVNIFNPFRRIRVNKRLFSPDLPGANASNFAVAVGLALRTSREQ